MLHSEFDCFCSACAHLKVQGKDLTGICFKTNPLHNAEFAVVTIISYKASRKKALGNSCTAVASRKRRAQ